MAHKYQSTENGESTLFFPYCASHHILPWLFSIWCYITICIYYGCTGICDPAIVIVVCQLKVCEHLFVIASATNNSKNSNKRNPSKPEYCGYDTVIPTVTTQVWARVTRSDTVITVAPMTQNPRVTLCPT